MNPPGNSPITPIDISNLIGEWQNDNPRSLSVKRIAIVRKAPADEEGDFERLGAWIFNSMNGGTLAVPSDLSDLTLFCESVSWGNTQVVAGLLVDDESYAVRYQTLKFLSRRECVYERFCIFKDDSQRRNFLALDRFTKISDIDIGLEMPDDIPID